MRAGPVIIHLAICGVCCCATINMIWGTTGVEEVGVPLGNAVHTELLGAGRCGGFAGGLDFIGAHEQLPIMFLLLFALMARFGQPGVCIENWWGCRRLTHWWWC